MLSEAEQAAYEPVLHARAEQLRSELDANADSARPPQLGDEIGRLTRMDALQQQQMALHGRRRLQIRLEQIRGALDRIREGTFGVCALCGTPIPGERLEFAPETPFCVPCQTKLEQDEKR